MHEHSSVTGSWHIAWVAGVDTTIRVGPQVGSAALRGRLLPDTSVSLDLNPDFADNNVVLTGAATATGLTGRWQWSGFPGTLAHGRFSAGYE